MSKTVKTGKYTYVNFANDVIALINGEKVETGTLTLMTEKANDLIKTHTKKAEYNANNPKKAAPKGASTETQANADAIKSVLTNEPMTTEDINAALNAEFTPLQVSNAIRFIDGVEKSKVIRMVKNAKGLTGEKEYTAYNV